MPSRRTLIPLAASLALGLLGLGATPAGANHGFDTGNGGYFEPPTVFDGNNQIVGPMYTNDLVNVHAPTIVFQGQELGAPVLTDQFVITPAGQVIIPVD